VGNGHGCLQIDSCLMADGWLSSRLRLSSSYLSLRSPRLFPRLFPSLFRSHSGPFGDPIWIVHLYRGSLSLPCVLVGYKKVYLTEERHRPSERMVIL
jgi:hypothetical protein